MSGLATREFQEDLQSVPDCLKPDTKPGVYLRDAPTEDEHLYVPFTETMRSCPLQISPSKDRQCDILTATSAGLVNRHYHPHGVFAYTIGGKQGYLEYDWTAAAGDFVYEAPGKGHTLVAYEHEQPARTFPIVKGPLVWLDEKSNMDGIFNAHDYIAMCHAYYDKIDVGTAYIDSLFRWPRARVAPTDARLPAGRPARPGDRHGA